LPASGDDQAPVDHRCGCAGAAHRPGWQRLPRRARTEETFGRRGIEGPPDTLRPLKNPTIPVGAMRFELITPGFGGQGRRSVAIRAGAKYVKVIGFLAMF
jgi:hypothetical protein